jgi:magnesium transporter
MKKNVYPLKESTAKILRSGTKLIADDNLKYISDLNDHILTSVESIDNQTETAKNHLGLYMSMTSLTMNNVMKVLTIISSIFIPLTFIAGVYGMNFDYMPELRWKYGYFIILGAMFLIFLLMILYFRIKKWL